MSTSFVLRLPLHGLRSRFVNWCFTVSFPIYAKLMKQPRPSWQVCKADLIAHPPGSLGRAMGHFLQEHGFELLPGFENHDVCHTLLAYGTNAPDEVMMQWCLYGNGKRTLYTVVAAFFGGLLFPEHWGAFRHAYRRGQKLRPFHHWYFEYLLRENTYHLRAFLDGKPTAYYTPTH